jgi:hypothetical protein
VDVGIDIELPLVHLSAINYEEKDDDEEEDDDDDDDGKADHPQIALPTTPYAHLSVVAATYHINSSPSPLSSGLQILKQLAVDV